MSVHRHILASCAVVAIICAGCAERTSDISARRSPQVRLDAPRLVDGDLTLEQADYCDATPDDCGAYIIETDDVVFDCGGARLIGAASDAPRDLCVGRGLVIRNARNVTIRNATIEGFKVAIYAENAPGLVIENCDVSRNYRQRLKSTPQQEDYADWLQPHANDQDEWLRYGAGVYLRDCDGARILGNRARDGQNGICLADCDGVRVERNDMSYMSGWGLATWRSNRCWVQGNRFDYCVRGYSYGVYTRGQDSAGILVFEQCNENTFVHNRATHCGDGFFLYAGHETLMETGRGGCNGNVVYQNDFSHSVAIGIEATFSENNLFVDNTIQDCRYGVWAGYSRHTTIAANAIHDCKIGVAIEHGQRNSIAANRVESCDTGIRLWCDANEHLQSMAFCKINDCASNQESIEGNTIRECTTGIEVDNTLALSVRSNMIDDCATAIEVGQGTTLQGLADNAINGGKLINNSQHRLVGARNGVEGSVKIQGDIALSDPADAKVIAEQVTQSAAQTTDKLRAKHGLDAVGLRPPVFDLHSPPTPIHPHSSPRGDSPSSPGYNSIFITEWGPFNHETGEPCVFPNHIVAWNEATAHVLGRGEAFAMRVVDGDVIASASRDQTPSEITIRPRDAQLSGATPFAIGIDVGGRSLKLDGVLLHAAWQVGYHVCPTELDPRNDADWRQVVALPPVHSETHDRLQFNWSTRSPHANVPAADRFGLIAETTMHLPAGRWRFRTISDDGVRVYVDGQRIIDNWTWHVPTEDAATIALDDGEHAIRVEYFDLVGHAQLSLDLSPQPDAPLDSGAE